MGKNYITLHLVSPTIVEKQLTNFRCLRCSKELHNPSNELGHGWTEKEDSYDLPPEPFISCQYEEALEELIADYIAWDTTQEGEE